jgi:hypothetical protein
MRSAVPQTKSGIASPSRRATCTPCTTCVSRILHGTPSQPLPLPRREAVTACLVGLATPPRLVVLPSHGCIWPAFCPAPSACWRGMGTAFHVCPFRRITPSKCPNSATPPALAPTASTCVLSPIPLPLVSLHLLLLLPVASCPNRATTSPSFTRLDVRLTGLLIVALAYHRAPPPQLCGVPSPSLGTTLFTPAALHLAPHPSWQCRI